MRRNTANDTGAWPIKHAFLGQTTTEWAPAFDADTETMDAGEGMIMPGLVESHFHSTYFNVVALEDMGVVINDVFARWIVYNSPNDAGKSGSSRRTFELR